jgi:hypothetical protein
VKPLESISPRRLWIPYPIFPHHHIPTKAIDIGERGHAWTKEKVEALIEEKEAECPSPSPTPTEEKEVEISRLDRGERGYRGARLDIGAMPPKLVSDSSSIEPSFKQ